MQRMERVLLSLGANVGKPAANLQTALKALEVLPETRVTKVSSVFETEPVGPQDQPVFLNMAAEVETALGPLELLDAIQEIEHRIGRTRTVRWGPREIDIDIVLWEQRILDTERLALPHTEFRKRAFVLAPLAEIAPDAVDPVTGLTVAELTGRPEAAGAVTKLGELATLASA